MAVFLRARALRLACLSIFVALSTCGHSSDSLAGAADFTVQYSNYDAAAPNDSIIEAGIKIRNNTAASIPLSSIVIRYWFTKDGATTVTPACWWWSPGCSRIALTTGTVSYTGADRYVQIGFTSAAGSLAAGATTQPIDLGIEFNTNVVETDDYSYGSQTTFSNFGRITVHDAGSAPTGGLRSGTPPSGSVAASGADLPDGHGVERKRDLPELGGEQRCDKL